MKFIYLVEKVFIKNDFIRFGVENLLSRNLEVEVWDVGKLVAPSYIRKNVVEATNVKTIHFDSYSSLKNQIKTLSTEDVIFGICGLSIGQSWSYRKLRKYIFKSVARIASMTNGHSPYDRWPNFLERFCEVFRVNNFNILLLRKFISFSIIELKSGLGFLNSVFRKYSLDYLFVGASIKGIDENLISKKTKVFFLHSLDADSCLKIRKNQKENNEEYIVYLDSMGPLHPEVVSYNLKFGLDASTFFKLNMKCLFFLQEFLKVPVVIAAHPRALPGQLDEYFSPFPVYINRTAELISKAKCVIAEPTLSIGMVAWFNKPSILLWNKNLPAWNKQLLNDFRNALGCSIWDVVDERTWNMPTMNADLYIKYKENYLKKSGSIDSLFWDFVACELRGQ